MEKTAVTTPDLVPEKEGLSCAECRYFFKAALATAHECRRQPPTAFLMVGTNGQPIPIACWPPVMAYQWCGEFLHHSVDEAFKEVDEAFKEVDE